MSNKINWGDFISKEGNFRNGTPENAADIAANALKQWRQLGVPPQLMIHLLMATSIHLLRGSDDNKEVQNAYIRSILERGIQEYDKYEKAKKDSL